MISRKLNVFLLVSICLASLLLVLPTINRHVEDPNLVVYFNHDEGYLMDLAWYYYSGEKRDSYQCDADYGLEMFYLSDLARLIFSKFVDFTPSTFVLILRWLHFIAWIGALIALWFFVGRHFQKGWQQILAVLILAVRPAFAYLTHNFKPEPLVLLLMIVGFGYILRIVENPSKKYVFIALALAAIAFLIKFAGIFLLPGVIAAIYFAQKYKADSNKNCAVIFPIIRHSWILEFLIGTFLITLPFIFIFCYVRKSTGLTFFDEFGFLQSLLNHKEAIILICGGLISIFLSLLLFYFGKSNNSSIKKAVEKINELNSITFIVSGIFFGFLLLFGFRWIIAPGPFLNTYSCNIFEFLGVFNARNFSGEYLRIVNDKLAALDLLMLLLLVFYLIVEKHSRKDSLKSEKLQYYKRMILLVMLMPIFLSMFTMGRFTHHHLLPFFVIMCILVIQGLYKLIILFNRNKIYKVIVLLFVSALLFVDILINAIEMLRLRTHQFYQEEDIVFDIVDWWRKSYPTDTSMVVDHPTRVYLPPEYKNVKFLNYREDKVEQLRSFVADFKPQLVYYNTGYDKDSILPPINEILPGMDVELVKSFDSEDKYYKRHPNCKFVIYKVVY